MYEVEQSLTMWHMKFDTVMKRQGFNRIEVDHCAYYRRFDDNGFIVLLLYVDDMLVEGPNMNQIIDLKS